MYAKDLEYSGDSFWLAFDIMEVVQIFLIQSRAILFEIANRD